MLLKMYVFISLCLFNFYCNQATKEQPNKPEIIKKEPVVELDIDKNYIMGKFDPAQDERFVEISTEYADKEGLLLRKETYEAFLKMREAAAKEGLTFQIRSATRNFDYQKGIWERKWTGKTKIENGKDASKAYPDPVERARRILRFSSMPGSSRHHWGTDIDLNNFENSYFETGRGLEEYNWLVQHAGNFGFCQVYTAKGDQRPYGYEMEKWHWSYTPLSSKFTDYAEQNLSDSDVVGFLGDNTAREIGVVEKYVLGINKKCRH